MDTIEILVENATLMWSLALQGTKYSKHTYDWMSNPNLGNLVLVSFTPRSTNSYDRIGIWESAWSYIYPRKEGDIESSNYDRSELVYGIRLFYGSLQTWSNVQLIRIPSNVHERLEAQLV